MTNYARITKIISISLCLLAINLANAQNDKTTGPLAKNRKPWKDPKPQTTIYLKKYEEVHVTGPLAKNRKIWDEAFVALPITVREPRELNSFLAKNARPERGNYWAAEKK